MNLIKKFISYFHNTERNVETNFLIIGNGRTGSTWLEFMLNNLPGVQANYEFKIFLNKYKLTKFHIPITLNDIAIIEKLHLYLTDKKAAVLGSKLILDANQFLEEAYFTELYKYFSREKSNIKLIHLHRSYYELFLSWNCRSIYHDLVRRKIPSNIKKHQEVKVKIYISGINKNSDLDLENEYKNDSSNKLKMHYYNDILFRLFSLFYNDLMVQKILQNLDMGVAIPYNEISSNFSRVTTYCGIKASQQDIDYVLKNPETLKLSSLENLIYPSDLFAQHARLLDIKLASVISKKIKIDNILSYEMSSEKIIIHDPDLFDIFSGNKPLWCEFKLIR